MPTNDATVRDELLHEMQEAKNRPPAIARADLLRRLVEADPPTHHHYEALSAFVAILMMMGILLVISGGVGLAMSITPVQPTYSLEAGGAPIAPDWAGLLLRWAGMIASPLAMLAGFMLFAYAQMLRLFIDLQGNADRQAFTLHALFQLALLNRPEEAQHEQIP